MYRNCKLQNREEKCVIFTQVKGEAGFPLFPGIPRALSFFKKWPVLAYVSHSVQSTPPGITIGIL